MSFKCFSKQSNNDPKHLCVSFVLFKLFKEYIDFPSRNK